MLYLNLINVPPLKVGGREKEKCLSMWCGQAIESKYSRHPSALSCIVFRQFLVFCATARGQDLVAWSPVPVKVVLINLSGCQGRS